MANNLNFISVTLTSLSIFNPTPYEPPISIYDFNTRPYVTNIHHLLWLYDYSISYIYITWSTTSNHPYIFFRPWVLQQNKTLTFKKKQAHLVLITLSFGKILINHNKCTFFRVNVWKVLRALKITDVSSWMLRLSELGGLWVTFFVVKSWEEHIWNQSMLWSLSNPPTESLQSQDLFPVTYWLVLSGISYWVNIRNLHQSGLYKKLTYNQLS